MDMTNTGNQEEFKTDFILAAFEALEYWILIEFYGKLVLLTIISKLLWRKRKFR